MSQVLQLLRTNRNYRYTWLGQVVSEIGDYFNNIAVFSLVIQTTGSGLAVSGVMLARAIPAMLAGPIAGVMLDRFNRKHIMIASDLVRAAVALGFLLCLNGERLYIAAEANNPDTLAYHVIAWLRAAAQSWFEQRAAYYAPAIGVQVSAIRLSNAKTRWGTCHPDGRIHLNWKLIQMPPDLIDYVVVHELAHLREPNHSRRFWHWVANVLPDYEQRRQTLRREGHRYLLANR